MIEHTYVIWHLNLSLFKRLANKVGNRGDSITYIRASSKWCGEKESEMNVIEVFNCNHHHHF